MPCASVMWSWIRAVSVMRDPWAGLSTTALSATEATRPRSRVTVSTVASVAPAADGTVGVVDIAG